MHRVQGASVSFGRTINHSRVLEKTIMTDIQKLIRKLSGHNYLNGAYVASEGQRSDIIDPATEQVIGQYPLSTDAEIDAAILHANAAQKVWWAWSSTERAEALHEVARKMKINAPRVGEVLTREMGKPFREANWEGSGGEFDRLLCRARQA